MGARVHVSPLLFVTVSLAAHSVAVWVLARASRDNASVDTAQYVEIQVGFAPPEPHIEPVAVREQEPEHRTAPLLEYQPMPTRMPEAASVLEPAKREIGPEPQSAAPPVARPARPRVLAITPRDAALSFMRHLDPAAECAPIDTLDECEVRDQRPSARERAESAIETTATVAPHRSGRPPPKLTRRSDGTLSYEGHVFVAIVHADGRVDFEDKILKGEFKGSPIIDHGPLDREPAVRAAGLSFVLDADLGDIANKYVLTDEIYTLEKRWFLEQTRELRDRLDAEHRARELARGIQRLHGKLIALLEDDGHHPTARRRAIFELWVDCSGDEIGRQAQLAIEAFVRERMPRGSDLGYSDAELLAFNAQRLSRFAFAPYE